MRISRPSFFATIADRARHRAGTRAIPAVVVAAGLLVAACQDDPTFTSFGESFPRITDEPLPALEDVPFGAVAGGRIAFHRIWRSGDTSGVYVIDGISAATSHHFGGSLLADPEVAPRGTGVAFAAFTSGDTFWDIYVAALDGTNVRKLSESLGSSEGPPTWDPAGRDVVFMDARECCQVYVRSAPPSAGIAPILHLLNPRSTHMLWPIPDMDVGLDSYVALAGADFLQILDPNDESLSTVYQTDEGVSAAIHAPSWSPDGGTIVFLEVVRGEGTARETRLLGLDVETGEVDLLATVSAESVVGFPSLSREPWSTCWAGGGSTVVFTSPVGASEHSVFAVPAPGGEAVRLTSRPDVWDVSVSCF